MADFNGFDGFDGALTVCDAAGVIVYLNDRAAQGFAADGGKSLIGTNMIDCHPEPARTKLLALMRSQQTNAYTIEKNGVHKLIYQTPWVQNGQYRGFIELSLMLTAEMFHFVRGV